MYQIKIIRTFKPYKKIQREGNGGLIMQKKMVMLIALMVIGVGFLSGCTSTNYQNNNKNNLEDEDTIKILVLSTERMHRLRTEEGFTHPDDENDFFTVEIKVTNIGNNEIYTSIGYATISDTSGMTYEHSAYTYALSELEKFNSLDIQPNNYNRGKILFEVPINCTVAHFYYNDLHTDITLSISEPELDIPKVNMTADEIYDEFNSTTHEIMVFVLDISKELLKSPINYNSIMNLGGDIVYLCVDYGLDILPLLPIPNEYEEARTEFNLSLQYWTQSGLNYLYYGKYEDADYGWKAVENLGKGDEHWANCKEMLGYE